MGKIDGLKRNAVPAILGVIVFALITFIGGAVKTKMDTDDRDFRNAVSSAVIVDNEGRMSDLPSDGTILVQGEVHAVDCRKFDEMKGCYSEVKRETEEYKSHTESDTCGSGKDAYPCSKTVWSWESQDHDDLRTDKSVILGREMPYDLVRVSPHSVSSEGITPSNDYYYYPNGSGSRMDNIRYSYSVTDADYMGVAFLKSDDGSLSSFHDFALNSTAAQEKENAKHPSSVPMTVFVVIEIIAIALAILVYALVSRRDE